MKTLLFANNIAQKDNKKIEIFTKIIESERKASILLQQRWSSHPEGESEIDFNAGEFALSLKTDCKTELRRKF